MFFETQVVPASSHVSCVPLSNANALALVPMLSETGLAGELYRKGALSVYESEAGYEIGTGGSSGLKLTGDT